MKTTELIEPHKDFAIVIGLGLKSDSFAELKDSLVELEDLVYAAGGEVVGTAVQVLGKYNAGTLIGSGKIQEISEMAEETEANLVVFDHQLTGGQLRNLEKLIGVRILDRNQLILDIFAQRAQTYEGKLQVELAQMLDQLPRMVGGWLGSLSRQAGGIGTRGPGESALELDRRRINERVKQIKKKLESVRQDRAQKRTKRKRHKVPTFALIGYTNSGKSTLLNALTQSKVLAKDQVFATLDPTTRQIDLAEVGKAVVTDTVGFIRKLPPKLIEAFKATLEESAEADFILHVIDLSSPHMDRQIQVVNDLIEEFQWDKKPILYIFNKVDAAPFEKQMQVNAFPRVFISAQKDIGIDKLQKEMAQLIASIHEEVELYFEKQQEHKIYELSRDGVIMKSEEAAHGTLVKVKINPTALSKWTAYLASKQI